MGELTTKPAAPAAVHDDTADLLSAMTPRFNLLFRAFARYFFRHFQLDSRTAERMRVLESKGSVIYVMRYSSRLDYFLFNFLFRREGLRLSQFANGLHFYYYRPVAEIIGILFGRLRRDPSHAGETRHEEQLRSVRKLVASGKSMFLFLRTARRRGRGKSETKARERSFLEEIVQTVSANNDRPVFVVPLAIFWRKGPRSERRFLNLAYGSSTRPSDFAKVGSFITTYRSLHIKVGDPIELDKFVEERRKDGTSLIARTVRRVLLIFFYREEKVVEGPTLRSPYKVQEIVLGDPEVRDVIARRAEEKNIPVERVHAEAEKIFYEIAANMNSTFLAILNVILNSIFKRMFQSIEITGLEKVAEYAKRHPLVLVPSHKSYFDFLILSKLFYSHYLVPPHIAARENMAFGPFGFIFRRAGAFFLRKNLDDPLYKEIFRNYVGYLVREGYTQEFFIEGGRSRTGKTLAPKMGMLSWNVEAFLSSPRRDLFFVPIAITYERLVEEGAMVHELEGGGKTEESMLSLVRARKFLQRRFGSVHVNFGEPISMAEALAGRRERFVRRETPEDAEELRKLIESIGSRIVERINWATVGSATAVAACALLGDSRRGLFRHEFAERMRHVTELLRLQDVRITPALMHDVGEFREATNFLLRTGLVQTVSDPRGEILFFDEKDRRALDLYRNMIIHFLVAPSLMARWLLRGATASEMRNELVTWLDLFEQEFFVPRGEVLAAHFDGFIDYFERSGHLERTGDALRSTEKGVPYFRFLADHTCGVIEAYYATFAAVSASEDGVSRKQLLAECSSQFDRAQLVGEVIRREAANPVTFGGALDLLVRREVLVRTKLPGAREGKEEIGFSRGPAFQTLPGLLERLASALLPR